jgi:hypothetical protein
MLSRPAAALAVTAALAATACYHRAAEPPPQPPPADPDADADLGWPTSLEFEITQKDGVVKHRGLAMFSVETRLPVFRSEPPAIAAALNARIGRLGKPDVDPRTHEGKYSIDCTVVLSNRYAVLLDCEQLLEERTHEEAEEGTGGAGEPKRLALGWWLRRGLPELSIEHFSPQRDLRALVDAELALQPAGCDLRSCVFDPKSFVIDGDGITAVPTEECSLMCEGSIPAIPMDELAPTHAWAKELIKRVRKRVEAGDPLVEGDRTH